MRLSLQKVQLNSNYLSELGKKYGDKLMWVEFDIDGKTRYGWYYEK